MVTSRTTILMRNVGSSRRVVFWVGLLLVILYGLWIGGPYLRSIVVRDAAVTTWVHAAVSPIDGVITQSLGIGERVGADGRIFTVKNPRADTTAVARARADLDRARERLASVVRVVGEIEALAAARAARAERYASLFKNNLDVKIDGMADYVAAGRRQLELERKEAARRARLLNDGLETPTGAEAQLGRVAELERLIVDMDTGRNRATLHRGAADKGLFFLDDGSDGSAEQRGLEDTRITLDRARSDLAVARRDVEGAQQVLAAAEQLFDETHTASGAAPEGAIVWSQILGAPANVTTGATVAAWIDCRILLVDAPVSDVELALLRPGGPADVVLEGERRARRGTIVLMRGAAGIVGGEALAAVAKGRRMGEGQVIVTLTPEPRDAQACPVGRAAFVDFPDVSVLDIARARMRW
jgi:multidrug resistance efflux pump